MKYKFFFIALIGLGLILLLANRDSGHIWGIQISILIAAIGAFLWGAIITSSLIYLSKIAKYGTICLLVLMLGANFYVYRYDLQDIGHNLTFGLISDSPYSSFNDKKLIIPRADNNHFEVTAKIQGKSIQFLVDTGATTVLLKHEDAVKIGIDVNELNFGFTASTANGHTKHAHYRLRDFAIEDIYRDQIEVFISKPNKLQMSLLGINFLKTLKSYQVNGDQMIFID